MSQSRETLYAPTFYDLTDDKTDHSLDSAYWVEIAFKHESTLTFQVDDPGERRDKPTGNSSEKSLGGEQEGSRDSFTSGVIERSKLISFSHTSEATSASACSQCGVLFASKEQLMYASYSNCFSLYSLLETNSG